MYIFRTDGENFRIESEVQEYCNKNEITHDKDLVRFSYKGKYEGPVTSKVEGHIDEPESE